MQILNCDKETKKIIETLTSDLNSFINLFKAYIDECGETDELYALQRTMKEKIKSLAKVLDIEFVENDFLV